MYSGLRTGASFVFDLMSQSRSAFDDRVGLLKDQVSSAPTREIANTMPTSSLAMLHMTDSAVAERDGMILENQWQTEVFTLFCTAPLVSV